MNKIIITEEMIAAANDYLPNAAKEEWVSETAAKCFNRLAITADDEEMPPMYMVNEGLRRRYLMKAFADLYMKQRTNADVKDDALMDEEEFDRWAGSHVFEQLQRMKHIVAVRDKCYDILADFKDLEKRLSSQLTGLLAVQNDFVLRQSQYTASQMKELPQILQALQDYQTVRGDVRNGD